MIALDGAGTPASEYGGEELMGKQEMFRNRLRETDIDRGTLSTGDGETLDMGDEVNIDVLNPPDDLREGTTCGSNQNDCNAIVLSISKDGHTFLLSSDIRNDTERAIDDTEGFGDVDVLQLAHHAGKASNSDALLGTDPDVTVFTGGEENIDNDGELADRYEPTYSTYDDGDVKFVLNEEEELLKPVEEGEDEQSDDD